MTRRLLAQFAARLRLTADAGKYLRLSRAVGYLRRRELRCKR